MPPVAMVFGVLLILLGMGGYFGVEPEKQHWPALIPTFVGGPLLLLGILGQREHLRKHAMHAAAALGLLGFLGGLGDFLRRFFTNKLEWGPAAYSVVAMIVLCGAFVALCVKS